MNNIKKHKRLIAAIVVILLAVLVEILQTGLHGDMHMIWILPIICTSARVQVRKNIRLYFLLQKDFIFRCSRCRGILKMKSSMI